jgi:hypothetical protein
LLVVVEPLTWGVWQALTAGAIESPSMSRFMSLDPARIGPGRAAGR